MPNKARLFATIFRGGQYLTDDEFRDLNVLAGKGDADSTWCLANYFFLVKRDGKLGMSWTRKAALMGHPQAQFSLGSELYEYRTLAKERAEGIFWLKAAAKQGHDLAKNKLKEIN